MRQFKFNPHASPFCPGGSSEHAGSDARQAHVPAAADPAPFDRVAPAWRAPQAPDACTPFAAVAAAAAAEDASGHVPNSAVSPDSAARVHPRRKPKSLLTEALGSGSLGLDPDSDVAVRGSKRSPEAPCTPSQSSSPSAPDQPPAQRTSDPPDPPSTRPSLRPATSSTTTSVSLKVAAVGSLNTVPLSVPSKQAGNDQDLIMERLGSHLTTLQLAPSLLEVEAQAYRRVGPADFQAIREIGQGAFGKVYLVQSRTTHRLYAMKVLNKQRVLQKEQVAYAMGERNVMTSLDHPYLVSLRFAFQTNTRLFLVMDYVSGGHLWTYMKAGTLREPVAQLFAAEIALALLHLHELGIAHRDLKPENILLDSDCHCRLTDFGLSKRDLRDGDRANTMVGTIDYMAPEVVKNDGHDVAVDWWSLGVLLYEMLFARLPFAPAPVRVKGQKGKTVRLKPGTDEYKVEVKRRIQTSKVVWPRGMYVPHVSAQAKDLIQMLLCKNPDNRLTGRAVLQHDWFRGLDWDALMDRKVPSPLSSSVFAGPADKIGQTTTDTAPLEVPCPRLADYLLEDDSPKGSPLPDLLSRFRGFTYVNESELARTARENAALAMAF